jgi:hypothetical protein
MWKVNNRKSHRSCERWLSSIWRLETRDRLLSCGGAARTLQEFVEPLSESAERGLGSGRYLLRCFPVLDRDDRAGANLPNDLLAVLELLGLDLEHVFVMNVEASVVAEAAFDFTLELECADRGAELVDAGVAVCLHFPGDPFGTADVVRFHFLGNNLAVHMGSAFCRVSADLTAVVELELEPTVQVLLLDLSVLLGRCEIDVSVHYAILQYHCAVAV